MTNKILLSIFMCFSLLSFSQEKTVQGKVNVNRFPQGINVENINREISVQTNQNGVFSIPASEGEILVFSSVDIERKIIFLKEEHFNNLIEVNLKTTTIEIEEVEIGNRIDLGLDAKELTPAERRYQSEGQVVSLNQGVEVNLEAVGNILSGKRKELKRDIEIEETNRLLYVIDAYFDEDFYVNGLGLAPEYIGGFKYFLVDDNDFREALKAENEAEIIMKAINLYEAYKKIKADEK